VNNSRLNSLFVLLANPSATFNIIEVDALRIWSRKDYHYEEGEEFFYQLEGDITLKVVENGVPRDIPIREGEIFLLPPHVPHSPQRPANTVGLVIERKRDKEELDGFQWYCEKCGNKLYEEFIPLTNIVTQLPPIFDRFYSNNEHCTCKKCGTKMLRPPTTIMINSESSYTSLFPTGGLSKSRCSSIHFLKLIGVSFPMVTSVWV